MSRLNELVFDENNIAFNPTDGSSYQFNEIGVSIVKMLQQNKSVDEIIEELSKEFEVEKGDLFIDVSDFISKLKIYGLL